MKPNVRSLLVSMTLANLLLLDIWRLLLDNGSYLAATQPSHFAAIVGGSTVLAAAFWCGMWIARRLGRVCVLVAKWLFFQLGAACLCCWLLLPLPVSHSDRFCWAGVNFALLILFVLFPWIHRPVATVLLALTPCVVFLWVLAAFQFYQHTFPAQVVRGDLVRLETEGPRVLVVVFDEMSEAVAFERRPKGITLPAFDRLRGEALIATDAYPPGEETLVSMPALITGKALKQVRLRDTLQIRYEEATEFTSIGSVRNMFSEAHSLGAGTAMIGWYHPYCSILQDVDFCAHIKADMSAGIYNRGGIVTKAVDEISAIPLVAQTDWGRRRREQAARETHEREDSFLFELAQKSVADLHSGLMVIHLPVPHPPALRSPSGAYFSNLEIADQELCGIRSVMENTGTWDGTTVLITSDHWWRTHEWRGWTGVSSWTEAEKSYMDSDRDRRVPFIIKLPGQHSPDRYEHRMNTLLTQSLIRELLTRSIRDSSTLVNWLDLHRTDVPEFAYTSADHPRR